MIIQTSWGEMEGKLPWEGEEHIIHSVCPDPYDLLTFKLIREEP
jgi:hypothetical protein